jgi:NADH-quinone oxidoreductase subunit J
MIASSIASGLAFYGFAAILLGSAAGVVTSRNPVHSVLFLILAFFNAAGLFLLLGAEFLAMILVIVYVGAVAVLFLFVVMMLDVNFAQLREGYQRYAPIGATVGFVLLAELAAVVAGWRFLPAAPALRGAAMPASGAAVPNTQALGRLLYTEYIFLFQAAGLILLVAMIGAIVLTLRERRQAPRRQSIAVQNARTARETLAVVRAPLGAGVAELGILRPVRPTPELVSADETHEYGVGKPGPAEHG